jgi:uncharacterized protein YbjT (DUF2867 family)
MGGTILVTGATGTVGSEVVKQLSSAGQKVRAAVRSTTRADSSDKLKGVELVEMDYNKSETLTTAFKDADKLFLLTPGSSKAAEFASNLVTEAKKAGIKHIVKQSLMGADQEVDFDHIHLHRKAERIIEESGIPFTFLRPNDFMQNFVNFYGPSIRSKNAIYLPAEDAKVSFVDVRDIAAVAVKALTDDESSRHNGKAYTLTGPEALSYYQAAEILSNETGKKIGYVNVSEEVLRLGMKDMGVDDWSINTFAELFRLYRKGFASQLSSAVEEVTGKKPISFSQFAKDYAQAFK